MYDVYLEFIKDDVCIDVYGNYNESKIDVSESTDGYGTDHKVFKGDVPTIINTIKNDLLAKGFQLVYEK